MHLMSACVLGSFISAKLSVPLSMFDPGAAIRVKYCSVLASLMVKSLVMMIAELVGFRL